MKRIDLFFMNLILAWELLSSKRKCSPFASMSSDIMIDVSFNIHVMTICMNVMVIDIKALFIGILRIEVIQ